MAQDAALKRDIETSLVVLEADLDMLPEHARKMDTNAPWWGSEWMSDMGRFEWLGEMAKQGQLGSDDLARYHGLLRKLCKYLVLTEQLDLPVPDEVLAELKQSSQRQPLAV